LEEKILNEKIHLNNIGLLSEGFFVLTLALSSVAGEGTAHNAS